MSGGKEGGSQEPEARSQRLTIPGGEWLREAETQGFVEEPLLRYKYRLRCSLASRGSVRVVGEEEGRVSGEEGAFGHTLAVLVSCTFKFGTVYATFFALR